MPTGLGRVDYFVQQPDSSAREKNKDKEPLLIAKTNVVFNSHHNGNESK